MCCTIKSKILKVFPTSLVKTQSYDTRSLLYDFDAGTIRVYCRVRPFLPGQSSGQSTVDYIGENGNIMVNNPYKQGKDARKMFLFNKVFSPNVSQGTPSMLILIVFNTTSSSL